LGATQPSLTHPRPSQTPDEDLFILCSSENRSARRGVLFFMTLFAHSFRDHLFHQKTRHGRIRRLSATLILFVLSIAGFNAAAQQAAESTSDDQAQPAQPSTAQAPAPAPQTAPADQPPPQTKRILDIIPNFRSVSVDQKLPPESVKDKFKTATADSFDYSSIWLPGVIAAYNLGTNQYPEFHQGAAGYARYFWHAAVDQTSENYMVEFIVPTITHEDSRYYTLGRGGFMKRTRYALSRAVVTRTDSGRETFNFSEVFGAGGSAGLSALYYPSRERSFGNVGSQWGLDVGIDAASFVVKEFWPDINRKLFHGKE